MAGASDDDAEADEEEAEGGGGMAGAFIGERRRIAPPTSTAVTSTLPASSAHNLESKNAQGLHFTEGKGKAKVARG